MSVVNSDGSPWSSNSKIFVDNEEVGIVGFQGHPDELTFYTDVGESLFGYYIKEEYRGRGYATGAARLLLKWGLSKGLIAAKDHTIVKDEFSKASKRVLQKLGDVYDGHWHGEEEGLVNHWRIPKKGFIE